jgi:predicted dehydrogenase/aryl-alcohol dehydrogenase-like predicted oxidoreductase
MSTQSNTVNWGILATGNIATAFAQGLSHSKTGKLVAVASRSQEKADRFGGEHTVAKRYGSYDALLADPDVHALYVATPHPQHVDWAIRAARAKKHVLVEKPLAVNHAEAMAIVEAAVENDVLVMEAYMYRCHPQTAKLLELIRDKTIGEVRVIQGAFSFHWPRPMNTASRLTSNALAGGGILDVGGYPVSMSRLIAGAAMGKIPPFVDPTEVKGVGRIGSESRVDEYASAVLKFPGDIIAEVSCGVQVQQDNSLRIYGSDGWIHVPVPWTPARNGGDAKIVVHRRDEQPLEITISTPQGTAMLYTYEADAFAAAIARGEREAPQMSRADSLGQVRTLDRWRDSIGLTYDFEKPDHFRKTTVQGAPLTFASRRRGHAMKYGKLPHVDKQVSRLIMGCDNQPDFPHSTVMFDDFFERGGNCFDTAYIYGGGRFERQLGGWIKLRGVREQVALIVKGAHTPQCDPTNLSLQLRQSLDRLSTDYADIYMMHRDNPQVPVAEFVDVLNEHLRAGRIKTFGGSNWTTARFNEASEYARAKGLQGFSVLSNNFSLARMVEAPWAGCISASDAESRRWFEQTQTPLLAWSSQARGFFVPGNAAPDKRDHDPELVRCWYSDDNFRRLARVNQLAKERNVLPINIALAYVLNQPFPTFALIGPRVLSETRTSAPALSIDLTPAEVRWLNLESDARG